MCCYTHDDRDRIEKPGPELMAESDQWRCRCKFGNPCNRKATREDILCDWCRERNHERECLEQSRSSMPGSAWQGIEEDVSYVSWIKRLNRPFRMPR